MSDGSPTLDPGQSDQVVEREQGPVAAFETEVGVEPAAGESSWTQRWRDRWERFEKSAAGRYWSHLSTADFMNSSFAFAALAVVTAFPFLAVTSAAMGGDIRRVIVSRMGLNPQATRDLEGLIGTGNTAVATLTWVSAIVLVVGSIGMASTLQTWYERIYEQPARKGLLRRFAYQLAGVAAFSLYLAGQLWLFDQARPMGGRGLVFLLTFLTATPFWWLSAYMLLYRQISFRRLLPAGIATGACLTGLGVVSSIFFSDQVTSGQRSYGPAGVVIAIVTFLVGFGVCLHAGAVFGRMWNERQDERSTLEHQRRVG